MLSDLAQLLLFSFQEFVGKIIILHSTNKDVQITEMDFRDKLPICDFQIYTTGISKFANLTDMIERQTKRTSN
jgi:hypothetical protein